MAKANAIASTTMLRAMVERLGKATTPGHGKGAKKGKASEKSDAPPRLRLLLRRAGKESAVATQWERVASGQSKDWVAAGVEAQTTYCLLLHCARVGEI